MDQCRFRRREMGKERPGRGEGGRRTAVRYGMGASAPIAPSKVDVLHVHTQGAARGSGEQSA